MRLNDIAVCLMIALKTVEKVGPLRWVLQLTTATIYRNSYSNYDLK